MAEVVPSADKEPKNCARPLQRPAWALPVVIVAIIAVAIALVVGVRGLTGNPVGATDATGITSLHGEFEPLDCGDGCVRGYLQDGGRGVFVLFPSGCPAPARAAEVAARGRLDTSQGKATYRATECATAG